jgi:aminoglycoside N3'-acetyltransferase
MRYGDFFLASFPQLEAVARNIYWRSSILRNIYQECKYKKLNHASPSVCPKTLIAEFRRMGIQPNDTLIIHSDSGKMKATGLGVVGVLDMFLTDVCPLGTIVCPTFPYYSTAPKGVDRLKDSYQDIELTYDVQRTLPWTGFLGLALMGLSGAKRSIHPLNTITAYGAEVSRIFAKEKITNLDLPCGPNSSWASLYEMGAKIITLGVDMVHSLTMIHVAEDCFESDWPIKDWYIRKKFKIINKSQVHLVTVRERHPRWALSLAERKLTSDLYGLGIANRSRIGDIDISVLDSRSLIKFLNTRKGAGYPYYLPWLSRVKIT